MVVGATPPASGIDDTYANDDWFDIDQYKKAAQVAYDFSLGKMEKAGDEERETIGFSYSKLFKKITDQNINVLFAGGVLNKKVRTWNRKNIKNYLEIYVKSNTKKIIKKNIKVFTQKQII